MKRQLIHIFSNRHYALQITVRLFRIIVATGNLRKAVNISMIIGIKTHK